MMINDDPRDIRERLVTEALTDATEALVIGWALIVEVVNKDGERELLEMHNRDLTPWQWSGYMAEATFPDHWEEWINGEDEE